jgi:alpha-galactosidase
MNYLFFILVAALSMPAADLTGRWTSSGLTPDGQPTAMSLSLQYDGKALTGYMTDAMGQNNAISNGKVNGDELSFTIVRDMFGEERKIEHTGKLVNGEIILSMPRFGGGVREVTFKRVSTEPPAPLPPAPLKIKLPPATEVPDNGLAKTPPMGWNSWNKFKRGVTDQLVRETADAIVSNGMKEAGYVYVNIDDTWEAGRDANGNILTNERFPNMKALADYVHGKGLKLGIYSSPGPKTCARFEGSFQHEEQDAKTYAAWGIDYLKYDWCSASQVYDAQSMQAAYALMGRALENSGRAIVYSLCQYGLLKSPEWAPRTGGNLWRTTGDIRDNWNSMSHIGFDQQADLALYAGPGHWNDPDMLEVGNGGMTDTEYRTHMTLWSLLAAPLLAGNDLRSVPPDILEILLNKEVIAVDQDPLGKQARRVSKDGDSEIWARPLQDGSFAVGLFNRGVSSAKVTARWSDIGLSGKAAVRDLWARSDLPPVEENFSASVPSHGVVLLKVRQSQ